MESVKSILVKHEEWCDHLKRYNVIIETASSNLRSNPDIAIESCKSLIEGVSKRVIVHLSDAHSTEKDFNDFNLSKVVKRAFEEISNKDDEIIIDDSFIKRCLSVVQSIGERRNSCGDISHGRIYPKELESTPLLAKLVYTITEGIVEYMLALFFSMKVSEKPTEEIDLYKENQGFNDFLDGMNELPGNVLYSEALFDQSPEDYRMELEEYKDLEAELC